MGLSKQNEEEIKRKIMETPEAQGSRLLTLEKERRGVEQSELVFIGIANVANYWWCGMKSYYKSIQMELDFFISYIHDRVLYSILLGYIDRLPEKPEAWLDVGDDITFSDIEKLLKEKAKEFKREATGRIWKKPPGVVIVVEQLGVMFIPSPSLPKSFRDAIKEEFEKRGIAVINDIDKQSPAHRGRILEIALAKPYPTIRWNFPWKEFIVVGVPDGITDELVYEFKTTEGEFLFYFVKPVALAQADLYGYFFKRGKKEVQIYMLHENKLRTIKCRVKVQRAKETLKSFRKVVAGELPRKPKEWKCRKCEFREECILKSQVC